MRSSRPGALVPTQPKATPGPAAGERSEHQQQHSLAAAERSEHQPPDARARSGGGSLAIAVTAMIVAFAMIALSCGTSDDASSSETETSEVAQPTATTTPATGQDQDEPLQGDSSDTPSPTPNPTSIQQPVAAPTSPPLSPTPVVRPTAPNGRSAPAVADTAVALAAQVEAAERGLAQSVSSAEDADWGHLHQVAIRKLGYEPEWDVDFFEALAPDLRARTLLHVSARRALIDLSSGYDAADFIPAWEIVEPEPMEALLGYYQEAEDATGIEWEFLAAINLVETGMGRIRGLSSAGAQGPMQFLPTTWDEAGIGAGDINDPRDAINSAARYLVRRGGPSDMQGAIWGYNNSDNYVTAIRAYAELLRQDPAAYAAIYNWEIYFFTEAGDVWLPTGFRTEASVDLQDYLTTNPWSEPDSGLR